MGFVAFLGRVLFSLIFVLSAWQEIMDFGHDGGAAVKLLEPKYVKFKNNVTTHLGVHVPEIEMKHLLLATIGLEGLGSILFIFGSPLGAYLLLIFLATVTPIMHDFYNYDVASPEYVTNFIQFLNAASLSHTPQRGLCIRCGELWIRSPRRNLSLFGALLFFISMNNSFRKSRKKMSKTKMH